MFTARVKTWEQIAKEQVDYLEQNGTYINRWPNCGVNHYCKFGKIVTFSHKKNFGSDTEVWVEGE